MWRGADIWLPAYLRHPKRSGFESPTDVMIAVCDHFEPFHHTDKDHALRRVRDWQNRFPEICKRFRDHDGQAPRHTFFYPIEQYDEAIVQGLAEICQTTGSEVEIHLHHDNDTEDGLREAIRAGIHHFANHQLLSQDEHQIPSYAFIHGNWALDHSDPEGRHCGVRRELQLLKETGCYGDFTMPSAPHPTQTQTVNQIYYGVETESAKSHNTGYRVTAPRPNASSTLKEIHSTRALRNRSDHLLLVQGPLGLNWKRRKWGILPRLENADLTGKNPPTPDRLHIWLRNAIHVQNRPEWLFVKLHCHGAINPNRNMLLGDPMQAFHQHLADLARVGSPLRFHYVSAREMVNIIHAAEDGKTGDPNAFRNYLIKSNIPFKDGTQVPSS